MAYRHICAPTRLRPAGYGAARANSLTTTEASLPRKQILLRQPGQRPEVGATEMGHLGGFPAGEAVATLHRFDDPYVHGKRFEPTGTKEEDAVGDLFADAGKGAEADFGFGVRDALGFLQPTRMRGEELGGFRNVAGAKAEEAGAEIGFGNGGKFGPSREAVKVGRDLRAVAGGEEREHLFDLDDLLRGAAEEAEERIAERLTQDAEAGKGVEGDGELRVAAVG